MAKLVHIKARYEQIYSNGMWFKAGYLGSEFRGYDLEMSPCGHRYCDYEVLGESPDDVECKICTLERRMP